MVLNEVHLKTIWSIVLVWLEVTDMTDENGSIAEDVFAEMDKETEHIPVEEREVEEVVPQEMTRKQMKIRLAELVEQKRVIGRTIAKMRADRKPMLAEIKQLRYDLYKAKKGTEEKKEPRGPEVNLTPEEKAEKYKEKAKSNLKRNLETIKVFADIDDLKTQAFDKVHIKYGREATEAARDELIAEGAW